MSYKSIFSKPEYLDRAKNILLDTKLEIIIYALKKQYDVLNFYPTLYDSQWHVSIRDGAIEYRLYPYHKRQDCIDECREMNKRYNA